VTQLFTYLLKHKLFSSCSRRCLVLRACDWEMPALSAVLLTFSYQFSLLFFHVGSQPAATSYTVEPISNIGRFRKLTRWQTDRWPTGHATRSVTISRAHSGEAKFCYCLWLQQVFIGTVHSLSWLHRADQLQQLAAIFSCTSRRVAVYLETHCNIGLSYVV